MLHGNDEWFRRPQERREIGGDSLWVEVKRVTVTPTILQKRPFCGLVQCQVTVEVA